MQKLCTAVFVEQLSADFSTLGLHKPPTPPPQSINPHVDFAFSPWASVLYVFPLSAADSFTEICAETGSTPVSFVKQFFPSEACLWELRAVGNETLHKPFSVSTGFYAQSCNTDLYLP